MKGSLEHIIDSKKTIKLLTSNAWYFYPTVQTIFLTILVTEVILTMWQLINNNFKRRA